MRKHTAITASIAAMAGLAVGITGTLIITHEPTPREHVFTSPKPDTFCDDIATRVLDMADVMLTAWENGTAYSDSFRVDNIDVYAEQLSTNCG